MAKGIGTIPRHESQHPRCPSRGIDKPGEHLQRGCLAGSVGTQEADNLAGFDGETDPIHRPDFLVLPMKQSADRPEQTLFFLKDAINLGQPIGFDDRHSLIVTAES